MTTSTIPLPSEIYVYVVVRADLPIAHQLVQACHASIQVGFSMDVPHWEPNIVALNVPDEPTLLAMSAKLQEKNIVHKLFFEPDDERGYTALATVPLALNRERKAFAGLPLIGSNLH